MTAQTILPANTLSSGYDVANSLRFNRASEDSIDRTPGSAGNQKKFTFSTWIKRSTVGAGSGPEEFIMYGRPASNTDTRLYFTGDGDANDDRLYFQSTTGNTTHTALQTNRKFRDISAWYNIVISVNTEDGNGSSSTIQMFINGVKETSFATETYGSQNKLFYWTDDAITTIGRRSENNGQHFHGYVAETVLIDGQALDADSFGEFDSDSPTIWKPKDVSGLTFGTNGFYLEFKQSGTSQNSSGLGADTSGNDNHFAVNNLTAVDQSTDTCTNNHATLNALFPEANIAHTEGNLKVTADGSANWSSAIGTIGLSSGKWYWEWTATSSSNAFAGLASEVLVNSTLISDTTPYDQNGLILYFTDGRKTVDGSNTESHFTGWSSGTMSCALDLDSGTRTAKFYHNGSQTGDTIDLTANFASGDDVFPVFMVNAGSNPSLINVNFGSPFYANSSDAADANGYGAFEFAPPSGYYTVNTKNLAEYG